jgi:ferric iron reductase protein FhuF
MSIIAKYTEQLVHDISCLETKNEGLERENQQLKRQLAQSKSSETMYYESCKDHNKKNKELMDFIATLLYNVGTPVKQEILKYQQIKDI